MFELVHPIAERTMIVTDDDLDRIEHTYSCQLPRDYRAFLQTFGPGTLEDSASFTDIFPLDRVGARTEDLHAMLHQPGTSPPWQSLFFDLQEGAADYFTPADIDRSIVIGGSVTGSTFIIVPGDPSHYYELPHDGFVGDAGTTMEAFLAYLDPRLRYKPHRRHIVENGIMRETDGRPDGTPNTFSFIPYGVDLSDLRSMVEQEVVWGHGDDPLVTDSLGRSVMLPAPVYFHTKHYPLVALLEAIALHDPSTRFEEEESDIPAAELTVPRFEAVLRAGSGLEGLTLYITVPEDHEDDLYRWFVDEAQALGYDVPESFLELIKRAN